MSLSNETIIVTGAAGNLGSAVARGLALRAARVICADRAERAFHTGQDGIGPDRILWITGQDLAERAAMDGVVAEGRARPSACNPPRCRRRRDEPRLQARAVEPHQADL